MPHPLKPLVLLKIIAQPHLEYVQLLIKIHPQELRLREEGKASVCIKQLGVLLKDTDVVKSLWSSEETSLSLSWGPLAW